MAEKRLYDKIVEALDKTTSGLEELKELFESTEDHPITDAENETLEKKLKDFGKAMEELTICD